MYERVPMPLIERRTHKSQPVTLTRSSEAYRRIYSLLEEHTYSWVTDAWKNNPNPGTIKVVPLQNPTLSQAREISEEHRLELSGIMALCKQRQSQVVLHVGAEAVVINVNVADSIMAVLNDDVA